MTRRFHVLVAVATLLVAGGIAAGLSLALGGGGGHEPTLREYLARVSALCDQYGRQLDRIAPPSDIAAYGEVADSVGRALPVLKRQTAEIHAIRPPTRLRARVERFMALTDRPVAELEAALAAAKRRDLGGVGKGLVQFSVTRDEAKALADQIGFRC